jgi:hypothetical protein
MSQNCEVLDMAQLPAGDKTSGLNWRQDYAVQAKPDGYFIMTTFSKHDWLSQILDAAYNLGINLSKSKPIQIGDIGM